MTPMEQRKARRFDLKLPFELIRSGSEPLSQHGETKNLSSAGRSLSIRGGPAYWRAGRVRYHPPNFSGRRRTRAATLHREGGAIRPESRNRSHARTLRIRPLIPRPPTPLPLSSEPRPEGSVDSRQSLRSLRSDCAYSGCVSPRDAPLSRAGTSGISLRGVFGPCGRRSHRWSGTLWLAFTKRIF